MDKNRPAFIANLLLLVALLVGALVRLYAVWQAGFIIHDGGLFHAMTRDLQAAGYLLPAHTSYNQSGIPFVYPPLTFYLLAGLNDLFGLSLDFLLRWLPAAVSILTIPLFYRLARKLLASAEPAVLATVLFALAPQAIGPQIMGGGLPRAVGALFTLLFLEELHTALQTGAKKPIAGAIACGTLVVLTHPEWALHAILAAAAFWLFFGRNRAGSGRAALVAAGVALLSAPWWGTVLARHGLAPTLAATRAPEGFNALRTFLSTYWTGEIVPVLSILAILGFFLAFFSRRTVLLPVWLLLDLLVEPRGSLRTITPQLAMLAALPLAAVMGWLSTRRKSAPQSIFASRLGLTLFGLLSLMALFNGLAVGVRLSRYHVLSSADRRAFEWVNANTAPGSRFLIFAPQDVYMSPVLEWFPARTEGVSPITTQGSEWLSDPERGYVATYLLSESAAACRELESGEGLACLADWAAADDQEIDYLYFTTALSDAVAETGPEPLLVAARQSDEYELVYESETVWIFAWH